MSNTGIIVKNGKLYLNGVEINTGGSAQNTFSKICVYGTSIETTPSMAYTWSRYLADALGLTYGTQVVNHGLGGGGVTWYAKDVMITDTITAWKSHVLAAFSCTLDEKQEAADYFVSQGVMTEDEVTASKNGTTWNLSYEVSLLEEENVDLYIFGTYGINDRQPWMTWTDDNGNTQNSYTVHEDLAFDRRTIYGAYNYVLHALYQQNPNAKVIILGQHTRQWKHQDTINGIQRAVAEKWQIPFADWGNHLSLNEIFTEATNVDVNGTAVKRTIYNTDDVHLTGKGAQLLGKWVADYITNVELKSLNPRWGLE